MKVSRYENKAVEECPLLKTIVESRNENKFPLTINGMSSLEYIANIKGDIVHAKEKWLSSQPSP